MARAKYVMIGGFLGAGKTTAIVKLAEHLVGQGLRVGVITNDQSVNLVDTARVRAAGMPVQEITGGCFCCKFNSLVEAARQLTREVAPDVLIAEPVGSCTDLQVTVSYPLRQLYGEDYAVAGLSVLVDPIRCARVLGIEPGTNFTEKVLYVYRKQLEEAELLVINKVDLLTAGARAQLREELSKAWPRAKMLEVSCKTGEGLADWFGAVLGGGGVGNVPAMAVDYDLYAEGEALLGWLNASAEVRLNGGGEFDGNAFLMGVVGKLQEILKGVEVGHLKLTLMPEEGPDRGAVSLTRGDETGQVTHRLRDPLSRGMLTINLRAEADPERLRVWVGEVLGALGGEGEIIAEVGEMHAFRPGRPTPTHGRG